MNTRKFKSILSQIKRNLQDQEEAFEAFHPSFARSAEIIEAEALEMALSQMIGEAING
jgi:hypothetical protein